MAVKVRLTLVEGVTAAVAKRLWTISNVLFASVQKITHVLLKGKGHVSSESPYVLVVQVYINL